jgi:alginate O-acetyltransferase complex protein AlgJ
VKKCLAEKLFRGALLACSLGMTLAHGDVVVGKNEWLFTSFEFANPADSSDTEATVQLLQKVNKLFEKNGITLALVIVPSKIRIHGDQLPESRPLDSYTANKYEGIVPKLLAGGVNVVNLNQAFLDSPNRTSETPLFMRLDTHWAPAGALLAAETVKKAIDATPSLKTALAATPDVKYTLTWAKRKINHRARDLVDLMPKESISFASEQVLLFSSTRGQATQAGLLGAADNVGITAIGSSYTNKNTGYPDALRYTLQRDLLDISIPVTQGPWVGLEAYLNDDAFKTNKPKLIIWEIPEREMRSPPNYKFRESRYIIDNTEWLARISNLLK